MMSVSRKHIVAASVGLLLAACASAPAPGVPTESASSVAGWSYWDSGDFTGLRPAGDLVAFDFPIGPPSLDHIDYVTQQHSGSISPGVMLSVTYTVTGTADLEPNTTGFPPPCGTAVAHLFFAVPGYSTDGAPAHNTQRWWSIATADLTPGQHTLNVPVDPASWLDVNGQHGDTQQAGFTDAIANVGYVGITFGASGCAAGHGVSAVTGEATLTIASLDTN